MIKFHVSNICSAFATHTIGTKVLYKVPFFEMLATEVDQFDWSTCREPGQALIPCNDGMLYTMSAGVGRRDKASKETDFVIRLHREMFATYLKREFAEPLAGAKVVVYTVDAYCSDPQVDSEEALRLRRQEISHVIVAVLGFAEPESPLSPQRFVENLAGGNKEALKWSADEIRAKAKVIADYDRHWCVVAD
jgi:hypothetical protein